MVNHNTYLYRLITEKVNNLFKQFSCVVVLGARQVGKSTLLKHLFPETKCIVFDPIQDLYNARQDPDLFLNNLSTPVILDEIQYVPELIPALKRKIDETRKPSQYLLTGSQQWGILKQTAESLAGRAMLVNLEGLSLTEIAQQIPATSWLEQWLNCPDTLLSTHKSSLSLPYSLFEQLWRGFLPETHFIDLTFIPDFHASYQRTYIERDVRLLAEVQDLSQFSRFVKLMAALTAQEVNYSELGRDIGITPQTAKRWLNTLIHTFEWFEIPAYTNNAIKKISHKPKGYFADTGQVCYSQMISSPNAIAAHPLWGALFENAVVAELRKLALTMAIPPQMYHWRSYSGAECDLILERDGKFYPIEIKAKTHPTNRDARGLQAFRVHHPKFNIEKGLIIAPCKEMYAVTENDYVIPWDLRG